MGWGKTRLAYSFPPLLFSNLSIYLSVFSFRSKLLLHCISILSPLQSLFISIDPLVFRFMLLFHCILTLNAPMATKGVCFSHLLKCLRSIYGKQCGPRSDCSYRSSLFWVYAVCFYTFVSNARQFFYSR